VAISDLSAMFREHRMKMRRRVLSREELYLHSIDNGDRWHP
jgi:hypothetical protein